MNLKSFTFLFFVCSYVSVGQVNKFEEINDFNVSSIVHPAQLQFINLPPENSLDSIVFQIMMENNDSVLLKHLVHSLGEIKSHEVYYLLFTCCCRPIVISDLNSFNSLVSKLSYYGGYEVLNDQYLLGFVDNELPLIEFNNQVFKACRNVEPCCYFESN